MPAIYNLTLPQGPLSPVVLSIPHVGTAFPDELLPDYKPEMLPPDDTDWYVDELYRFASQMGIHVLSAHYSRWVIDLNRNPDNQPLYTDGRVITGLCPVTNFMGQSIYKDQRKAITEEEITRRKQLYFEPYHQKLQELLDAVKNKYGKVLLWDCHSIRRHVPAISQAPFPDIILGSADETSADKKLIDAALQQLGSGGLQVAHNHPFKGGFITRHFGKPNMHQHALQLEMCKDLYMVDTEIMYNKNRAGAVQPLLQKTLESIIELLT